MITVLTGDGDFDIQRALQQLIADFDGIAERIDGAELRLEQLSDALMASSLFADRRLVIIRNLSENKTVWVDFVDWLPRVSDDIHLVLVEPHPDKRTRTYKELQKSAKIEMFVAWGDRDTKKAVQWAVEEARRQGFILSESDAMRLVGRTGVDQWRVFRSLEKLAVLDTITPDIIDEMIDVRPADNVFELLEAALAGNHEKVHAMTQIFRLTEDPFRVFGLLSSQVFQLLAAKLGDKPSGEIAKDIGAHPYVISKLIPRARQYEKQALASIIETFVEADTTMKSSAIDPWICIERALQQIAHK